MPTNKQLAVIPTAPKNDDETLTSVDGFTPLPPVTINASLVAWRNMATALAASGEDFLTIAQDALRYRHLRAKDLESIAHGGVFGGLITVDPEKDDFVLSEEELDIAIDEEIFRGAH